MAKKMTLFCEKNREREGKRKERNTRAPADGEQKKVSFFSSVQGAVVSYVVAFKC